MCNLNTIIKTGKLEGQEFRKLVSSIIGMTTNSYLKNDDGEGFYFNHTDCLIKQKKKINLLGHLIKLNESKFIIGHERISTSGFEDKYLQPFSKGEFVLEHNGVLSSFVEENHSDTYCLFNKFLELFESKKGSREERITQSIKELFDDRSGTYSIGIFDKVEEVFYYFKNSTQSIQFYGVEDEKILYITTRKENKDILNLYYDEITEYEIEDYKIYSISVKEKVKIMDTGVTIKKHEYTSYSSSYKYNSNYWDYEGYKKEKENKELSSFFGVKEQTEKEKNKKLEEKIKRIKNNYNFTRKQRDKCFFCNGKTRNFCEDIQEFVCGKCMINHEEYLEEAILTKYEEFSYSLPPEYIN